MAQDRSKRINPKTLAEDLQSLEALETINTYAPANPRLSLASLRAFKDDMSGKQATETQKIVEADTARDEARLSEWELHEAVVGMRDQVVAQYGRDSNEAQAVGRKKDSERKRPTSKK